MKPSEETNNQDELERINELNLDYYFGGDDEDEM